MLLAGDIGGTKVNLGVFSHQAGPRAPLAEGTFSSTQYPNVEALIGEFLAQVNVPVDRACLGMSGPVVEGRAKITNLPWVIDQRKLKENLSLSSVRLLNDLEAMAYGVPLLEPRDLHTLQAGQPIERGAIAVIAPGTGLGEAFLTWDGTRYVAHASEGGHTDFAPTSPLQLELWSYLHGRFEHISYERVCSGQGLPNLYEFLRDRGHAPEPDWLARELAEASDPTPIVIGAALDEKRSCGLCVAALNLFVSTLGAEAGNLALKILATGGVYLGGGIPPRILPALEKEQFIRAFLQKGRMSSLLTRIPVHVILNPKVALLGAAWCGLQEEIAPS